MAYYYQINHDLKLIAVFSPKCACQTIGWWFLDGLDIPEERTFTMLPHHRVEPTKIPDYADYLKVLFIRDPLRRLVSFYAQWVVHNNRDWCFADEDRRFSLESRTFRRFMYVLEHLSQHGLTFQHHLEPQLDDVPQDCFDRIILVEDLGKGLRELNRELGIAMESTWRNRQRYAGRLQEPVADRSPQWLTDNGIPPAGWFYDEEILAIAEKVYAKDVEFYRQSGGVLLTPV